MSCIYVDCRHPVADGSFVCRPHWFALPVQVRLDLRGRFAAGASREDLVFALYSDTRR